MHVHQRSDIRLKTNVGTLKGGLDVVRSLQPRTFDWKENAQEIANSPNPSAYSQSHSPNLSTNAQSQSTKDLTRANTLANSNISPDIKANQNPTPITNSSPSNANGYTQKQVQISEQSKFYSPHTSAGYPDLDTTQSYASPPSMIRHASVPAKIHTAQLSAQVRASSEYRLPTRNPAHPDYPFTAPSHPGYPYYPYVEGYVEETYGDSEYEVSDDSDDEDDEREGKTRGFIAQEVQKADPRLVHVDPRNGILSIDTVGMLACMVDAVKDLDIRTSKIAAQSTTPAPPLPPPIPKGSAISLCSIEKGYLVVNEKALNYLRTLPSISILSICGPRKIAKSFFCNMFLPRDVSAKEKFAVGTNEGTKGLWLYNSHITAEKEEKKYLILDTQAIDSTDENAAKVMCLVWLISSVVAFKDYRSLDIQKFDVFRSVRNMLKTLSTEHEAPALAALIDDDLKITDSDKYINDFVKNKQHPQICEAVSKCFPYRKVFQLSAPKPHELESKDYYSGNFYTSFLKVKENLESLLLDISISIGTKEATGQEFAKYLLECVTKLNNLM